MANKPYRLSVKAVIFDDANRILLLKRSPESKGNPDKWDLPGGKVDPGENFEEALHREIFEETGLNVSLNHVLGTAESENPVYKVAYLIFAAYCTGGEVHLSHEHPSYAWVSLTDTWKMDLVPHFATILQEKL